MSIFELMWTFFLIGLFTIGGGQVAITLMYEPIVGGNLLTAEEFYNMLAISESTPGPIGINMATYIGCGMYGVIGGIATTFATVLPSLLIILFIAKYFDKYQNTKIVKTVFTYVRPVSAALIFIAAWNIFQAAVLKWDFENTTTWTENISIDRILLYLIALVAFVKFKISPIILILCGAIMGIVLL